MLFDDEIEVTVGATRARVSPTHGALTTSLVVDGREMLFLDPDPSLFFPGGIPLMLPNAGRLVKGIVQMTGTHLPLHGFGHSLPWEVVARRKGALRLALRMDEAARAAWPWPMAVEHEVIALDQGLHMEMLILNQGKTPMPFSPGWHPYFRCPADRKREVHGDLPGTEPGTITNGEQIDKGVPAPPKGRTTFQVPEIGPVAMAFSPEIHHVQMWTLPGWDFVCLEPFFGPPNTLNSDRALIIPAGGARALWFRMEFATLREGAPGFPA